MNTIRLVPKAGNNHTGRSKFGGWPDLPASIEVPKAYISAYDIETNLAFICQLNLAEFPNSFAPTGMLYFFSTIFSDSIEGCKVIYYDGNEPLTERQYAITEYMEDRTTRLADCDFPLPTFDFHATVIDDRPMPDQDGDEAKCYTGSKFLGKAYLIQDFYHENVEETEPDEEEDLDVDDDYCPQLPPSHQLLLQLYANEFGDSFEYVCGKEGYIYFALPSPLTAMKTEDAIAWMAYD